MATRRFPPKNQVSILLVYKRLRLGRDTAAFWRCGASCEGCVCRQRNPYASSGGCPLASQLLLLAVPQELQQPHHILVPYKHRKADIVEDASPATEVPEYVQKYCAAIARIGFDPEGFARAYSVPLRITPARWQVW